VEILLLGPPELRVRDQTIPIGGRRQQIVLVLFALNPGQVLTTEWLVDQLWAGSPPPSGVATLRAYVSRLRSVFENEAETAADPNPLVRRQSGYLLEIEREKIDVHRFDRAIDHASAAFREGRSSSARLLLRGALAMWRGTIPLGDLSYEPFALTESLRLTERRLEAIELCMDAELASSRHSLIVSELQQLVMEYPLRERFWQQLMVSLYRSGRQGEALASYTRLRRHLIEELGIEPAPETRQVEQLVLEQSSELDLLRRTSSNGGKVGFPPDGRGIAPTTGSSEGRRRQRADRLPLVGREPHMATLREAVGHRVEGLASLAVVVGEAGCGKTRLLSELATWAESEGFLVARGAGDEDAVLPYAPFGALVRSVLEGRGNAGGLTDSITSDLAWLAPEIGQPPPVGDPSLARARLTEGVLQLLRSVEPGRPLVLLIDDVHRMGNTGSALLRAVVERPWPRALSVVVASRPPGDPEATSQAPDRLLRQEGAFVIEVGRLSHHDVSQMVDTVGLGATAEESARIATLLMDHSGGVPLLVRELVATLSEGSTIDEVSLAELAQTSVLVRSVIGNRVAQMSDSTRRILEVAAIAGSEIDVSIVAAVSDRPRSEIINALDEGTRLGLVVDEEPLDDFRFDHALVRRFFEEQVSASRTCVLHAQAAAAFAVRGLVVDAAIHALTGVGELGAELAAGFVVRAARAALSALDFERSRDLSGAMIDGWGSFLTASITIDLLMIHGKALTLTGGRKAAEHVWVRAADLARGSGDPERFLEVALEADAHGQIFTGSELRWSLLNEAMGIASETRSSLSHAVATAWAGEALARPDQDFDESVFHTIVSDADALEDPELSLILCHTKGYRASGIEERRYWFGRLEDEARAAGDEWLICRGFFGQLSVEAAEADGGQVAKRLSEAAGRLGQLEHPAMRWCYEAASTSWARIRGYFDEADAHAATAASVGERFAIPDDVQGAHSMLSAFHRGTLSRLHAAFVEVANAGMPTPVPGIPVWYFGMGLVLQAGGDHAGAWDALAEGLRRLPGKRQDELWEMSLCLAAEIAVSLKGFSPAGLGEALERLQYELAPLTGMFAVATLFSAEFGPVDRSLALLAAARQDPRLADRHFLKALETCQKMGARAWELRTQADQCAALVRSGREPVGVKTLERQLLEAGLGGGVITLRAAGLAGNKSR
jgi:DNA-binding SARP family transcriptional activator